MANMELLKKALKGYFDDFSELSLSAFLKIENILCVLSKVSPKLNPSKAYVLLRGYQLINHGLKSKQLFWLQQARMKFLTYASKMQWEKDFGLYMDKQYENIRLYSIENNILVKTDKNIPVPDREHYYWDYINTKEKTRSNMPMANAGRYKFYREDKQTITVDIPDSFNYRIDRASAGRSFAKQRKKIEIKYEDLLKTALKMKDVKADDYCHDVLTRNKLVNVKNKSNVLSIEDVVNIVGMVGSGKSTLLKVISFYLAENGYRAVIVLNSINEVIEYYKYFKALSISVSPLVGKSNQEKYVYSLLKNGEKYLEEDIAKYLSAPCILNGLNNENKTAWEYSERPCYNLHSCDAKQKRFGKYRCPFFEMCPGSAMLREAEKSSIVITTVAGLAASFVGKNHHLFLEEVIDNFDVVMFDECDRVQNTLDDFFAPNTAFNDFINSQADASAVDMKKSHSAVDRDRNERRFFNLTRDAISVYDAISYDIDELVKTEKGAWKNLVTSTFSALTLIERMHSDKIDPKLEEALRQCVNVQNDDILCNNDLINQLSEIIDGSCREDSHIAARLNRLFSDHKINLNEKDYRHIQLLLKVIFFDRFVHRIDDAAKSVDREVLRNNNISDFLQARFITQQKFLPSAPMGNMFGMMYSKSDEKLKIYRQYACGRYLMLSLPWLKVDEAGSPLGPHAILLSGSSYAPGSLQYHINVPVNYILESSEEITGYLGKSIIRTCGATTVISGGSKDGREERISKLLYEIRQDIEAELNKPGKILLIVNSYAEAHETWIHTKRLLNEIKSDQKCAVLIRDDETRSENCMLRKNDLIYFDDAEEKILVAPAAVICRGYNILDKNSNSAIRSVFFLVRPMSVPDDVSLKVSKLNGYISMKFCNTEVYDWGTFSDKVKTEAGKFWDMMQKDSAAGLRFLSDESKRDVVATVFIMLDQIYGRSARVSDISKIGEPPRIYFADGAFNGGRGDGSFEILKEICDYIKYLMQKDGYVAKALYESFYNALKENVNYESTETTSDDDFYTESFND
ncbi:MAG: hypothetical protein K2G44_05605 [Clostridia bacterium]|nr:hypothetical protein [Clostridia bacterium]